MRSVRGSRLIPDISAKITDFFSKVNRSAHTASQPRRRRGGLDFLNDYLAMSLITVARRNKLVLRCAFIVRMSALQRPRR